VSQFSVLEQGVEADQTPFEPQVSVSFCAWPAHAPAPGDAHGEPAVATPVASPDDPESAAAPSIVEPGADESPLWPETPPSGEVVDATPLPPHAARHTAHAAWAALARIARRKCASGRDPCRSTEDP
jgi:hypothetical protein